MMIMKNKPQQKLISFTDNEAELATISKEMSEGWNIISLTSNGNNYIGIMEKTPQLACDEGDISVFIPPRKKIRFVA